MPAMSPRHWVMAAAVPFLSFGIFLAWRFSLEGSLARTAGLRAAIADVIWKAAYRAGFQDDYPVPVPFAERLWWMHEYYFSPITPWVLAFSATACVILVGVNALVRRPTFPAIARPLFVTLLVSALVTLPVYAQMWTFRQHTVIHPFSSAKLLMPYAFLPFVALPLLAGFIIDRVVIGRARSVARSVMVAVALAGAVDAGRRYERPYLIGRIDPARMEMWETIRRNVSYRDVVFSPDLEAPPFKVEMGVANKIVYAATTFAGVDRVVRGLCGPFNIVVVFTGDRNEPTWDGRMPTTVVRDGGLTFFRFVDQQGPARECP
jgi:hypothetical protein